MESSDGARRTILVLAPTYERSGGQVTGFPDELAHAIAQRGADTSDIDVRPRSTDQIDAAAGILDEASGVVFVLSATGTIPDTVIEAWDACDDLGLPRAIVICDIDSAGAQTETLIEECQEALGDMVPVLAVHLPVLSDDEQPIGLIDFLSSEIIDYSSGRPHRVSAEDRHRDLVRDERSWLLEAIISETENDALVSAYLAGDPIEPATLTDEFRNAIRRGRLHPILLTSAQPPDFGIDHIVDIVSFGFPRSVDARP